MSSSTLTRLIAFVGLIAVVIGAVTREHHTRATTKAIEHHSMHPPHLRDQLSPTDIPFFEYSGSTVVTDNYIRLTPDTQSRVGMVWNVEPLDLSAFEVVMGFRVHSQSGYGADGMALWIVDEVPDDHGPLFGHPQHFVGIGVLFDSYDNDRYRDNPAVHVLYNPHGTENRDYNPQQDFRGQQAGNCYFDYRNTPKAMLATVRLRYKDNTLEVYLSKNSEKDEILCATVRDVQLNPSDTFFVGVTAETGGISDHHDVHFIHTYPLDDVHYDHDVYKHEPFSHNSEADSKQYWRAKTPEELALEEEEKRQQAETLREESTRRRRAAEESNRLNEERRLHAEKKKEEQKKKDEEAAATTDAARKVAEEQEEADRKVAQELADKAAEAEAATKAAKKASSDKQVSEKLAARKAAAEKAAAAKAAAEKAAAELEELADDEHDDDHDEDDEEHDDDDDDEHDEEHDGEEEEEGEEKADDGVHPTDPNPVIVAAEEPAAVAEPAPVAEEVVEHPHADRRRARPASGAQAGGRNMKNHRRPVKRSQG